MWKAAVVGVASAAMMVGMTGTCEAEEPLFQLPLDYTNHVLATRTVDMEAGKDYALYGSFSATQAGSGALMAMQMICRTDNAAGSSVWSTRNHEGALNGVLTARTISGQWMFSPTVTGTYECQLYGQGGRSTYPDETLDVMAKGFNVAEKANGAEWRGEHEKLFGIDENAQDVKVRTLLKRWTASQSIDAYRIYSGTEVSVRSTGGGAPLLAKVTLQAKQEGCPAVKRSATQEISGTLHHFKFNQVIDELEVRSDCESRDIEVAVYVEYLLAEAGDPERHGGIVHDGSYTSAFKHSLP